MCCDNSMAEGRREINEKSKKPFEIQNMLFNTKRPRDKIHWG